MAMKESTQHKLDRVRPPRVQITYDLELAGAVQRKSLPLVVGILADLSGHRESDDSVARLKDRKFVEIDRDNFNEVMAKAGPRLALSVPNAVAGEGSLQVELKFGEIDDFEPLRIVKQVEVLSRLYEQRVRLADLLIKLDGNDDLEKALKGAQAAELEELKALSAGSGNGADA
jgi:type VI secretion system protein ImpB